MDSPATALIVEPSPAETLFLVSSLSELGFRVVTSDNFQDAKARMASGPALLITELRLGEYNGLHLIFRAKSLQAHMAAIIRTDIEDRVLRVEAERMGATFLPKTTAGSEFRAAVCRTVFRRPDSSEPIRPPFERRAQDRRSARVLTFEPDRRVRERRVDATSILRHRPSF